MLEEAKTKGDFNTQDSGKNHRELDRGESGDPFILWMKTLNLKSEVTSRDTGRASFF